MWARDVGDTVHERFTLADNKTLALGLALPITLTIFPLLPLSPFPL